MKVQIIVKVDGSRAITTDVALSDKENNVVKQIPNGACCRKRDVS